MAAAAPRRRSAVRILTRRPWFARLIVIAGLFALWEIAARWFVDPLFLSPPSQVIASLDKVFSTRGVPAALQLTLFELTVAFVLAVAIGLVLGLAIGLQPLVRRSFFPIVLLLYGMPQVTILPLFILFFGIGAASKIAFGVTHGVFPVIGVCRTSSRFYSPARAPWGRADGRFSATSSFPTWCRASLPACALA